MANKKKEKKPLKGKITKSKAQYLRERLQDDFKFDVIEEYVEVYRNTKGIYGPIVDKIVKNCRLGLAPLDGLSKNEISIYKDSKKDIIDMLKQLFGYVFPKLRALELEQGVGEKVIFNIGVPDRAPTKKEKRNQEFFERMKQTPPKEVNLDDDEEEEDN